MLANRLSADGASILLLEAGKMDRNWLIHVPLGVGKIWQSPAYNWKYNSEPEPGLDNRSLWHPRGRVVGGSSSINMMAYVRGHRADYDRWRQKGLEGWSYADVLPYFKRMESFDGGADGYRGDSGPLRCVEHWGRDPLFDAFVDAGKEAGFGYTDDFNGAEQEGVCRMQFSIGDGRRFSSATAYLRPALKRGNITVRTGAQAARVVFDGNRAAGIAYKDGSGEARAHAGRDVILCGGAYNSPHLLMLSGIGPAAHLREMGIEVRADRGNVGENLQDHTSVGVDYAYAKPSPYYKSLRLDRLAINMIRAYVFHQGPATLPPGAGTAFLKSRPEADIPDIQMFFRPVNMFAREWFPVIMPPPPEGFSLRACHLRPESRGWVKLRSADPFDHARVFNDFLSTEADRQALRDCIRMMREIARQPALDGYRGKELAPGEDVASQDGIDAFIRQTMMTVFHPIGTCRMGSDDDSVVDLEFRVRGVEGLRVVDASVMPDLVGGNINIPVMMVAEKASDVILGKPPLPAAELQV